MRKIIIMLVVLMSVIPGVDGLRTIRLPGTIQEAEAKTYYDWNSNGFKSVSSSSGQTFDYNTGQYGRDYSRGN